MINRKYPGIVICIIFVFVILNNSAAQHLKVDISTIGQSNGYAPNFSQWIMPINSSSTQTTTFDSLTLKLDMTSPPADATHYLKCQYANKDGQTYNFKLSYDGIWPHWKDDAKPVDMPYPLGGSITLTISGLSTGSHNIITYHNNPFNESKTWSVDDTVYTSDVSDCIVTVDSVYTTTITPTVNNRNDATCAYAFFTIEAVAGTPVVISLTPAHNRSMDNVFLNGFEIDAPGEPSTMASEPLPLNGDIHVDVNNDDPNTDEVSDGYTTLSWIPSSFAISHNVYFGTNQTDVRNAGPESTPIFKGNQTDTTYLATGLSALETYYWRIDEVDATGTVVTQGEVWSFSPRRIAFPGAEGWGRFARGGRGGRVIHVTNLNDSGSGSLRAAIEAEGPRTVVFDVSGLITLSSRLILNNPYCTIAGQTAPGKGICIRDYDFGTLGGSDFIIRFVRVRVGKIAGTDKTLGSMGMGSTNHSIIDHCSISWSQDEAFSSRQAGNITLQRTLISEALHVADHKNYPTGTSHGYAASIGGKIASFHHNLLAHCEGRNWSLAGGVDPSGIHTGSLDIRNNVVYNWDGRTTDGGAQYVNFVRNYYKPGPATNGPFTELNPQFENPGFGPQQYYVEGNVMEGHHGPEGPLPPFDGVNPQGTQPWPVTVSDPFFEHYVNTHSAAEAYENVLNDVGCNWPMLDDHDKRIIYEVRNDTFTYSGSITGDPGLPDNQMDVGGWEDYPEIHRSADFDTDLDGMPDSWETSNGLNPNDPEDRNAIGARGYTNLEIYLNSITGNPTAINMLDGPILPEFILWKNYPNPFNPSTTIRYNLPEKAHVKLIIYNVLGEKVKVFIDEEKPAGMHIYKIDMKNMPSGVYFYMIKAGSFRKTKKMVLIR